MRSSIWLIISMMDSISLKCWLNEIWMMWFAVVAGLSEEFILEKETRRTAVLQKMSDFFIIYIFCDFSNSLYCYLKGCWFAVRVGLFLFVNQLMNKMACYLASYLITFVLFFLSFSSTNNIIIFYFLRLILRIMYNSNHTVNKIKTKTRQAILKNVWKKSNGIW